MRKLKEEEELIRKGLKVVEGLDQFDIIVVKKRAKKYEEILGGCFGEYVRNYLGFFYFKFGYCDCDFLKDEENLPDYYCQVCDKEFKSEN